MAWHRLLWCTGIRKYGFQPQSPLTSFCPGAGHLRQLSFLLIWEVKEWTEPSPRALELCLRKCRQNIGLITNSLTVAGKNNAAFYIRNNIHYAHVLVSLPFCFNYDLGKGLENHCQIPLRRLAGICWLFGLNIILCQEGLSALSRICLMYNTVMQPLRSTADGSGFPLSGSGFVRWKN